MAYAYEIFIASFRQGTRGLLSKGLMVGGLALVTFEFESDPDPVGAGAQPLAVQNGLCRCHGQHTALAKSGACTRFGIEKTRKKISCEAGCDCLTDHTQKQQK